MEWPRHQGLPLRQLPLGDPARCPECPAPRRRFKLAGTDLPLVSFRYEYAFEDGATLVCDSTPRFRTRAEVEGALHESGHRVLDVREAPDRPGKELVVPARLGAPAGRTGRAPRHGVRRQETPKASFTGSMAK